MYRLLLRILALTAFLAATCTPASAQILADRRTSEEITDSLRRDFDHGPYFTLYKDNYFLVGCPTNHKPNKSNSDVKFQISISQKLTRSTLPWNTYLFLMYTQKVFWNVFERSMPMRDFIFNPGIGITKPLFSKDRFIGKVSLILEHESNGRDSTFSRSWNRVSLSASIAIDECLMVHGKVWIPIVDGENNRDILRYAGIWQNGVTVTTLDKKWSWDLTMVKRKGWNLNFNTILGVCWRPWKSANQYLYLQWYNGYGEDQINYNKYTSMVRLGICIKPRLFSDY